MSRKTSVIKEAPKRVVLTENNDHVAPSDLKLQNFLFIAVQPVSFNIIKPWSITCPSTVEPLQKFDCGVNTDLSCKVSLKLSLSLY